MKDLVTNGSGNSRFLKSSIPDGTTWEEALVLFRSGAFPIDLNGLNPAGVSQTGSAYSKGNVLPDALCTTLGLSTNTAEPKDAFNALNDKINTNYQTYQDFVSNDWTEPGKIGVARENLLDNPCFIGGGSQDTTTTSSGWPSTTITISGAGKFPVNQKGNTTYTAAGYCIDRWKKANANGSVTLGTSGMTVIGTGSAYNYLDQPLEGSEKYFGKQMTISILNTSGALATATGTLPTTFPSSETAYATTSAVGNVSVQLMGNSSYFFFRIRCSAASSTAIQAVKLEIGPNQTLARQSGTSWILNEMPNYGTELLKCQRFLFIIKKKYTQTSSSSAEVIGAGAILGDKAGRVFISLPVEMRTSPSCSGSVHIYYMARNGNTNSSTVSLSNYNYIHGGSISLSFSVGTSTSSPDGGVACTVSPASDLIFDANL